MKVWKKLPDRLMAILSDDVTDELSAAVQRISGSPLAERQARSKDLGETMVIAHAAVAAESGVDVIVLIDEGPGTRQAAQEARRLDRMRGARAGCRFHPARHHQDCSRAGSAEGADR